MNYYEWAMRHPQAAAELNEVFKAADPSDKVPEGASEARTQQQARLDIAHAGAMSWRNNVGATPAKMEYNCARCGFHGEVSQRPVRYGLANDSAQMNSTIKSSDLILAIPRVITPAMVGTTIAQFGAVECKAHGWQFTGKGREGAQQAWLALIESIGGYARFSTGRVVL